MGNLWAIGGEWGAIERDGGRGEQRKGGAGKLGRQPCEKTKRVENACCHTYLTPYVYTIT